MKVPNNGGSQLLQLTLQLHADLWQALGRAGITPLQAYVLLYVHEQRNSAAKVSDIARLLRLRLPTVSELLKGMKRKKWLTSQEASQDRRVRILALTKYGQGARQKAVAALEAVVARYNRTHTGTGQAIRILGEALKQ